MLTSSIKSLATQVSAGAVDNHCQGWLVLPNVVHSRAPEGFRHMSLFLSIPNILKIK